ncbi:hypothetical protein [Paenibacillus lentus]|uniref:Flagellar protein n=1 Tax=Paenibacillus lentus TaxID=1338368 RepID=A0A3Q8SC40_9BACL|nr:hypothetical protein [Paenibacillus lentus]AZK47297.1 hypothetical protein EIM92_14950 [Paenibacillus lentus]
MALINCDKCGVLMIWKSAHLCSDCLRLQFEEVNKVKDYLAEHPQASIMEVERKTKVSLRTIQEIALK